jgi:hypothetical protein
MMLLEMVSRLAFPATLALIALAVACSDDEEPGAVDTPAVGGAAGASGSAGSAGGSVECDIGEVPLPSGDCLRPGHQENGCAAGQIALADGACGMPGVPPARCAAGFEPADDGCAPVLPPEPCGKGLMAVPGEVTCRRIAPCGAGTWGDIPVDGATQHVDASYAGGDSDGSSAKPWTTIGEALEAAAANAIVALAAGSYSEDLTIERPVRLWGRCPELVEIVGSSDAAAAVSIGGAAAGTQLRDLAIRGDARGVEARAVAEVLLERIWIHDTVSNGLWIRHDSSRASVTVRHSLFEATSKTGLDIHADAVVEASVVRDTQPDPEGGWGNGIFVAPLSKDSDASLILRRSLVERNHEIGVSVGASRATLEATVVRDTLPRQSDQSYGIGILAIAILYGEDTKLEDARRASIDVTATVVENSSSIAVDVRYSDASIRDSVIREAKGPGIKVDVLGDLALSSSLVDGARSVGVWVNGSTGSMEATIVRNTTAGPDGTGAGVAVLAEQGTRGKLDARTSIVEHSRKMGLWIAGSDINLDGVVVRDTLPAEGSTRLYWGRGIQLQVYAKELPVASIRSSLVERNYDAGIIVGGGSASIVGTVVRDTEPDPTRGYGAGIHLQYASDTSNPSQPPLPGAEQTVGVLRGVLIERSSGFGLAAVGSDAKLYSVILRDTRAQPGSDFGDGLAVLAHPFPLTASAVVERSRIESSQRAGISSFGGSVELAGSNLECNAIDINGEAYGGARYAFELQGALACGCANEERVCRVSSSKLTPPSAL